MDAVRTDLLRELGESMSQLSEDCWCAGWLVDSEYLIPELCRRAATENRAQPWGLGSVSPEAARELLALAAELGHWAILDDAATGYLAFTPFPIPAAHLDTLDRELNLAQARARGDTT